MKRTQLENKFNGILSDSKSKIESNPTGAFLVGLVVGIALTWFRAILVPLLLLASIAAITFWLLAQGDDDEFPEDEAAVPPSPNGSTRSSSRGSDAP